MPSHVLSGVRPVELCSTHKVSHWRYAFTSGTGGGRRGTATKIKDTTCMLQPISVREAVELNKVGLRVNLRAYFSFDPKMDERDEIRYVDGSTTRTFIVQGIRNLIEAGRVWAVDLEERTDVK